MPKPHTFKARYGPWALVTGAARGMGSEFARQIAAMGLNLVLVDLLGDELAPLAEEIERNGDVEVKTVVTDLSKPDFPGAVREQAGGLEIGLLVSNAAVAPVGLFFDRGLEEKLSTIYVNVRAPLLLVEELVPKMIARRRGGIILVSSASALQGVAYVANYAATKAYNLILAESLWDELRGQGVDVLGFMPGATRTTGFKLSRPCLERGRLAPVMEPGPTVAEALKALGRKPSHVAGRRNRLAALLVNKLVPRRVAIRLVGGNMRGWYGAQAGAG